MDLGSVIIAVSGVAGTLGGSLLTQRVSERAKRREIELVRDHEEVRENLLLRRTCYVELNRDARQFTTALGQFLHAMQERRSRNPTGRSWTRRKEPTATRTPKRN